MTKWDVLIETAIGVFNRHISRPIMVYYDPDVDGLFSGKLVTDFLDARGIKHKKFINANRGHGFKHDLESLRGYFVIAVDFAMTTKEMELCMQYDISVLCIDHHDVEPDTIYLHNTDLSCECLVVNNQYPFASPSKRYLSGAGVVYETLCKFDSSYASDIREALVGITLLSDARPIENDDARAYLTKTYTANVGNRYIHYLLSNVTGSDYGFGSPRLDRNYIDYVFSPIINAMLRFNKHNEALAFILGYPEYLENLRDRQKEVLSRMKLCMKVLDMSDMRVVVVKESECAVDPDVNLSNFIGLLASDIKGTGKSVLAFILCSDGVVRRASFRGRYEGLDYRGGFQSLGINAQGHHGAFGIVDFTFTADTWSSLNSMIAKLDEGHETTINIIESSNLAMTTNKRGKTQILNAMNFMSQSTLGYDIALENNYVRDLYRTYIRYTGCKIVNTVKHKNYYEYLIDGLTVKGFSEDITPTNGLILPVLEKGYIVFYLRENIV